ncbi:hypothetical protein [Marinobacter mangrovi]|nr:hypothetical protein [Marinobacter mangrovi]
MIERYLRRVLVLAHPYRLVEIEREGPDVDKAAVKPAISIWWITGKT